MSSLDLIPRAARLALFALLPLTVTCGGRESSKSDETLEVTEVSPLHGSARGGDTVTLHGQGFGTHPTVRFGGLEATVTRVSDTAIAVLTPPTVAGPVKVEVEANHDSARLDKDFTFEALPLTFVDVAWQRVAPLAVDGGSATIAGGRVFQAAHKEGVWVYSPDEKGYLTDVKLLPTDADPVDVGSVLAADFDGDGNVDLFLGATSKTPSRILFGDGKSDGSGKGKLGFAARTKALPPLFGTAQTAIAVDLDGDGDLDLVTVGAAGANDGAPSVVILANDGKGRFTDVTAERLPGAAFNAVGVTAGDVDGDGHVDLFFSGDKAPNRLYLNDGHGVFQLAAPDALPNDPMPGAGIAAMGDLDGDGSLDIYIPGAQDQVLFNDGTGHFIDLTDTRLGSDAKAGQSAVILDLDRDGHADVVVVDQPGRLRILRNDGTGRLFDYSASAAGNGANLVNGGVALGDVDGDGDLDIFVSRAGFARAALFVNWSPLELHDSDSDGFPDAVDNCPDTPNPDQANVDSLPFRCDSAATCQAETKCTLSAFGTSAYLVCGAASATWAEAGAACEARGGELVTIASAEQNAFLLALGVADAWIGYSDTVTKGTYAWSAGSSSYTNWAMMQPDDGGGMEDCAVFLADGTWNDAVCDQKRGYVCQDLRSRAPDPGDACDACPSKYEPGTSPVMLGDAGTCLSED